MEKKKNLAASVRARLAHLAKETGESLQNLLTRFANERLIYRLSQTTYRESFLLKGATLFAFWFNEPHRPTKDLDLLGYGNNDIETLENVFRKVCQVETEDGLQFLAETIKGELIRADEEYQGVRVTLTAMLERARIPLQVDVGFGDAVTPVAEEIELNTILDFPAARVRGYPKETVVAEKFEAMVKLGLGNGRMKDFWDVRYLVKELEFDGTLLQKAVRNTFANRQTELPTTLPTALTDEFARNALKISLWKAFIDRNKIKIETDFKLVIESLRDFFTPIIEMEAQNTVLTQIWTPQNGWQQNFRIRSHFDKR